MTMTDELVQTIAKLPAKQRDVLGCLAMNEDGGYHPATIKALLKKGLIVESEESLHDGGWPPAKAKRYDVPLAVDQCYREWCAAQPNEETP